MQRKGTFAQVKSGLQLAGNTLLAIATVGLLFVGMEMVIAPKGHVVSGSFLDCHSPIVVGWVFLATATVILLLTINRWVKILPGLLGYGVFSGLLCISSGHLLGNPSIRVSRLDAVILTLLFAGSSALSLTFRNRELVKVDRIALMAFVFIISFGTVADSVRVNGADRQSTSLITLLIAFCCLVVVWAYDRIQRHRKSKNRSNELP